MKARSLSIGLLIALISFPQLSETIYTPALPEVAADLKATAYATEATLAIYFIGFALGVAIWGFISDGWGRRTTLLLGLGIYAIGSLACGKASSVEALLAWRSLQAFGASVGSVITQTMIRDLYEGKRRAQIFATIAGALAISPAVGPLLGGYISELWGWRANFTCLVVMAACLTIWSWMKLPETRPLHVKRPSFCQLRQLLRQMMYSAPLWGHILLISSTNGILFGFYEEGPFVFIEQLGLRPSQYGLLGLLIAGAMMIAAQLSYRLNQHSNPEQLIKAGAWLSTIGAGLFTLMVSLHLFDLSLSSMGVILLALLAIFIGIGLIIPNSLSIAMKPYQAIVGTASSIFGGCYYILIAFFTWSMSLLHNGTAIPLALYMTALGMTLLIGSYLVQKKSQCLASLS
jgi:Bcr/CflA subfamily drug resistance transporter